MANRKNTFLLKRSNVAGNVPVAGQLLLGELALNTADVKLYTSGTTSNSILPIGWDRISRTGDTMTGSFSAPTISATTYYNLPKDVYVTGGTFSDSIATFTNNTGGTFSVSGFGQSGEFIPYTGATQDADLGVYQLKADSLAISTASTESVDIGEIVWNAIDGTFDMGLIGGVTLQAGQEMHFYGKATEAISNGQAVMFAGVQGDHILIAKADAATINTNPEYFIGVATQSFVTNQFGYVTAFGKVRGLNTLDYTLGTILYYDSTTTTDGLLTSIRPTAPNAKIEVAAVVRVHGTEGVLMVRPHVMPKISDFQDVNISGGQNLDILQYNSSAAVWANTNTPRFTSVSATTYLNLPIDVRVTGGTYSSGTATFTNNTGGTFNITGFNTGTVTNVSALTVSTGGTDVNSTVVNSTTTPVITLNVPTASASNRGALSSTDWSTFNSKIGGTGNVGRVPRFTGSNTIADGIMIDNGFSVLVGGLTNVGNIIFQVNGTARVSGVLTLNSTISNGTNTYTLPSTTGTLALTSQLHNAVTLGVPNGLSLSGQQLSLSLASGSTNGALSSTDWNTFNNKQNALNGTGFVRADGTTISYDNSTYVPTSRTLSINGTSLDLSTNRSWVVPFVTANTFNNATYDLTISASDGTSYTSNLGLLSTDVRVTGGTYNINTGVVTFTNSTGGTFNVTGFSSGMTDTFVTGGTYNAGTATFTRSNNQSFNVTGFNTGTVTSVGAITLGTSGTDLSSSVANGTTTPVITLNVPTASASNRGALSSVDWSTFNSKQAQLNGTGFIKANGTSITYDNSTYYLASNPNGYTTNTGTVTQVNKGNGLDFSNFTTSGTITLGTPSSTTLSSTNATTTNSHSHAFAPGGTTSQYITGAGTLVTFPTIPTVNDGGLTLATSGIATGSASFTANQAGGSTFTVNVPATDLSIGVSTSTAVRVDSSTGTDVSLPVASSTLAGVLTATDWSTFNGKQAQLNGTGFIKANGTSITYDNSSYYLASNPNGYISSFTETDPTVPSHVKAITTTSISNWNTAFGWGNHASAGYVPGGRTITINGTTQDLSANRSFTVTAAETDTLATVTSRGNSTTGNITVNGDLSVKNSLLSNQSNSVPVGTTAVFSNTLGSTTAAFFDYVVTSGSNARAGSVMVVINGGNIEFTETSTNDIGDTSRITLKPRISGGNILLDATSTSGTWTVKVLGRLI
jgi:hypothetical protein